MSLTSIKMPVGNRMIRLGIGQNNFNMFVRIDLWYIGYRLTF